MSGKQCFWWGVFGAILPEIVKFFKLAAIGNSLPPLNWVVYAVFLLLFAGAAGLFSVAWRPESPYKAIWIGASLPLLVSTLVQAVPKGPGRHALKVLIRRPLGVPKSNFEVNLSHGNNNDDSENESRRERPEPRRQG